MVEKYTGFHSIIDEVRFGNPPQQGLSKRYGPKAHGLELGRAIDIVKYMRRFTTIAQEINVPVAESIGHAIYQNGHPGKVDLCEYVPKAGPTVLTVIQHHVSQGNQEEVFALFSDYLTQFGKVWNAGSPISLDPPLTNFCLDSNGKIIYIDLMPPRQRLDNGIYISEWPEPPEENREIIERRYFSPEGQLPVIYAQALRALVPYGFSPATIQNCIGETLGPGAVDIIRVNHESRNRVLKDPNPGDMDFLRIIAAEMQSENMIGGDTLKKVYELCHVGIGGILPTKDEVTLAGTMLVQACN